MTLDQPFQQPAQWEYASFWDRVLARIIDGLVLAIPSALLFGIPAFIYFSIFWSFGTATLGQRVMGIRVVSLRGQTLDFWSALLRFICDFLNSFTLGIGYLLMLFNNNGQCLHDMLIGTVVIKTRSFNNTPPPMPRPQAAARPPQVKQDNERFWSLQGNDGDAIAVVVNTKGVRVEQRGRHGNLASDYALEDIANRTIDLSWMMEEAVFVEIQQYAQYLLQRK